MKKIILFIIIIISTSCEPHYDDNCHATVKVINNSQKVIYSIETPFDKVDDITYPDDSYTKILPHSSFEDEKGSIHNCYEDKIGKDKIFFYILDYEKLGDNPSSVLKTDDMVLKKLSFTLKEMQDANWTVTYDGN